MVGRVTSSLRHCCCSMTDSLNLKQVSKRMIYLKIYMYRTKEKPVPTPLSMNLASGTVMFT